MPSKLHIPPTPCRLGEVLDFSKIELPITGELDRPHELISSTETRELSYGMIRVLDDDYRAIGPWNPNLAPEVLREGLRHMLLTRLYDDRMEKMQRQGKMSFYMKSTGEEGISVAQCMALKTGDMLFPTYRQQALLITRGYPLVEMMCQCLSNAGDKLYGRQLPVFYSSNEHNFFSISGNLGTQFSQAVGWAMAAEYKGTDDIAATWVGEGSSAEADFHYGLTFSAVYCAPVILNVVNNQWAISTFQNIAGGDQNPFAARGIGYGIPGLRVDGNDFLATYAATQWAANRARQGGGPTLIELYTYRAAPHSTSDDPSKYRPVDDWVHWPLGDPIERLKKHLISLNEWSELQHTKLTEELDETVKAAWEKACSFGTLNEGPRPSVTSMFEDVYKEIPGHLIKQRKQLVSGNG
jgi:2-oxoisovalerate dehydrogenase E1 component alpha subunit